MSSNSPTPGSTQPSSPSDPPGHTQPSPSQLSTLATLVTPDTLPQPAVTAPRSKNNASTSGSQTETPGGDNDNDNNNNNPPTNGRVPSSNISPKDVDKWLKTGSFGKRGLGGFDPMRTVRGIEQAEGEEDDEGEEGQEGERERNSGEEPCFSCGGKVEWDRGGGFWLICVDCGRKQ